MRFSVDVCRCTHQQELSDSTKITIIVVVVVVGSLLLCLCGLLFYMYRRERRGEPLFTKLEEVRAWTDLAGSVHASGLSCAETRAH